MDLVLCPEEDCALPLDLYVESDHENSMFLADELRRCDSYTDHRNSGESSSSQPLACPNCPMTFSSIFYLRDHLRTHEESLHLYRHHNTTMRDVVITSGRHRCSDCCKSYLSLSELEDHMAIHLIPAAHLCKECGKMFRLAESLDVHLCSHLKFAPAPEVNRGSAGPSTGHIETGRSITKVCNKTCLVCNKTFRNASYFQLHVRTHAGDKTFTCQLCEKSFSCSWNLKTHLAVHRDEKPFVCGTCGVSFKLKANMQRHERSHTSSNTPGSPDDFSLADRKPYSCSVCGMAFKVKANVIRHERLHSNKEGIGGSPLGDSSRGNGEMCETIPQMLSTSDRKQQPLSDIQALGRNPVSISRESLSIISPDRRHTCKVCGKTYKQRCHLLSHVISHSDARPYVCNMCGKSFSLAWNLKTHLAVHNQEKPFACALCGSTFKLKTALQRHERSHTSLRAHRSLGGTSADESGNKSQDGTPGEVKCPGCERKFGTFRELHAHMLVHNEPEVSYPCKCCGLEFGRVQLLTEHLDRAHSQVVVTSSPQVIVSAGAEGEIFKDFVCCVCDKEFVTAMELQIHKQMHS